MQFHSILKRARMALTVDEIEVAWCCHRAKARGASPAGLECEIVTTLQDALGLADAETWDPPAEQILFGCIGVNRNGDDIEFRVCEPDKIITKHEDFKDERGEESE